MRPATPPTSSTEYDTLCRMLTSDYRVVATPVEEYASRCRGTAKDLISLRTGKGQ